MHGGWSAVDTDRRKHRNPTTPYGDWLPVVELCESVAGELPAVVPGIVAQIRAESPQYAGVPRDDHERHVSEQFHGLLTGLASRRPPTAAQTEVARELGRLRARQGVPVEEMIGAYHVGYREMWNVLLARADIRDPNLTVRLVRLVDLVWTWVRLISSASADAHVEAIRAEHTVQITLAHRFLEALRGGEASSDEAVHLARALAFDPDGGFQAACVPISAWSDDQLDLLQRCLRQQLGTVRSATRGSFGILVFQCAEAETVVSAVRETFAGLPVGVGLARPGLAGAESSIVDAERALAVAVQDDSVVFFDQEWLLATLLTHRQRLAPLLQADREIAGSHPHLAEAVRAYADNGFSVTGAGRAMHLHPNTVKYRLERWRAVTGWDPRTPTGLTKSLLSLRMFPPAPTS
jgi:hypothetical protein